MKVLGALWNKCEDEVQTRLAPSLRTSTVKHIRVRKEEGKFEFEILETRSIKSDDAAIKKLTRALTCTHVNGKRINTKEQKEEADAFLANAQDGENVFLTL